MSSSNLVRITAIKETTYGVTPDTGNFQAVRFISEALSGTPDTVESQQIRTDRMSSGQVVTGLSVGGNMGFELAKETALENFIASAMYNTWTTKALLTVGLTIDATAKTITRASGSWTSDTYAVGDFVKLGGFAAAANNVSIMIAEIVSATVIRVVGPETLVDGTGVTTTLKRDDKISIGVTKQSFSMEKKFLDLDQKGINYRGMIASQMDLNVAFGSLINGSFTFVGNDYQAFSDDDDAMTDGRTIDAAATTNTLNGSVDMPFVATSAGNELDASLIAISAVQMTLNDNTQPQNVIGNIAPRDYSAGTAAIAVSITCYLDDAAWPLLANKLSQESFAVGFQVANGGGAYSFFMPAVQVSFDDPASGGQNQDIKLDMKGTAKVGDLGESALTIYRR